jgi:hypothetical protein
MARPLVAPDPVSLPVRSASSHVPAPVLSKSGVAVEFQVLAASIGSGRRLRALRDQLDRASVSIVLNIAEGSG